MRFFGTTIIKFAVVATDSGMFKVLANGTMELYDDESMEFNAFNECDYKHDELAMVRQQGLMALEMQ
jgi:hypothetical protein